MRKIKLEEFTYRLIKNDEPSNKAMSDNLWLFRVTFLAKLKGKIYPVIQSDEYCQRFDFNFELVKEILREIVGEKATLKIWANIFHGDRELIAVKLPKKLQKEMIESGVRLCKEDVEVLFEKGVSPQKQAEVVRKVLLTLSQMFFDKLKEWEDYAESFVKHEEELAKELKKVLDVQDEFERLVKKLNLSYNQK